MIEFSIVVVLYNQVAYTRLFIESLVRFSDRPYELIIVDNGSTDGTKEYIKTIKSDKIITNENNLGVTKAWNQGINHSKGKYICLINNDLIVGPNWMSGLASVLNNPPNDLATLSPSTNGVTYFNYELNTSNVSGFAEYARQLQQAQPNNLWAYSLIGSCMVIPRTTLDKAGLFDERYFCWYNDLDFHLTSISLGLTTYTTSRSTIYHFGGASAKENPIVSKMKEEDKQKFLNKWRKPREFLNQYFAMLE